MQINFSGYTNKFWGHFVMFSGLLANKNKIPRYKYTKEQPGTKKLCTGHLRICVSVCDLNKSQPNAVISLENTQIHRYALEPAVTFFSDAGHCFQMVSNDYFLYFL